MTSTLRVALLTLAVSSGAAAQVIPPPQSSAADQWVFGFNFLGGLPRGEFKNHEDGGGGAAGMVGYQPWRRQPLVLRLQGGAMLYSRVEAVTQQQVCDFFTCHTEEVRYNARNHSMAFVHFGPELMATDGLWRPFGYALAGYTFFNSWANLEPSSLSPDQPSEQIFSSHNFSTVYGGGIRRVSTHWGREAGFELSLDVTRNAKARYLTEEGVHQNSDGTWTITPRQGAANVLGIHLGFWIGPNIRYWERR